MSTGDFRNDADHGCHSIAPGWLHLHWTAREFMPSLANPSCESHFLFN